MEIRKKLDAIVSSKSRLVKAPPSRARAGSFARIVESRPDTLAIFVAILARASPRSMRGSVSCRWCSLSASASSRHYSL